MKAVVDVLILAICFWSVSLPAEETLKEREIAAAEVAATLMQKFKGKLNEELGHGGPEQAIRVCAEFAPMLTGKLSREHGMRITRVGTRVRNPLLGMPDAWEQQVLKQFAERAAQGESLENMTYGELVAEPAGKNFRFMRAIAVQPACLSCHGSLEQIPASVCALLKESYPFDKATGYKVCELRGAVSIKQPLE